MKVILHDEKYLSLTSEIFLQKNTRCGQIIIYTVFILLVAICVSLFTIRIDEVVKVQGVVKTQTNISTVKNIVSGKVLNINYFSGKIVKKNDLLFKIDDSNLVLKLNSEKELEKKYLKELKINKDILNLLNNKINYLDNYNEELYLRYNSYLTKVNKIKKEIEIAENTYNDEKTKPENLITKNGLRDKKNNLEYLKLNLDEYKLNYKTQIIQNIKEYENLCLDINNSINNLKHEIEKTNVYASVDGIVQELQNYNVGDFIFSAQDVLKIVPSLKNSFKAQLYLNSIDVAKIKEGLNVKLRFPAYPFYEFKGLTGKIENLESDTTNLSNKNFYKIDCQFDEAELVDKKGKVYELRSGLDVDARIVIEKKSIIKFLLSKLDFN